MIAALCAACAFGCFIVTTVAVFQNIRSERKAVEWAKIAGLERSRREQAERNFLDLEGRYAHVRSQLIRLRGGLPIQ